MSQNIFVHTQYGSVKPGEHPLVHHGYDYYEIKFGGHNMCVPRAHVEGQPLRRIDVGD